MLLCRLHAASKPNWCIFKWCNLLSTGNFYLWYWFLSSFNLRYLKTFTQVLFIWMTHSLFPNSLLFLKYNFWVLFTTLTICRKIVDWLSNTDALGRWFGSHTNQKHEVWQPGINPNKHFSNRGKHTQIVAKRGLRFLQPLILNFLQYCHKETPHCFFTLNQIGAI